MLEIQALSWESDKDVAELSLLMGSQPSPLDNWISNGNIQMIIKTLHRFTSTQKRPHTITKINDNMNMESTIAGLMNARS